MRYYPDAQTPHTPNLNSVAMLDGRCSITVERMESKKMGLMMVNDNPTKRNKRKATKWTPQLVSEMIRYAERGLKEAFILDLDNKEDRTIQAYQYKRDPGFGADMSGSLGE